MKPRNMKTVPKDGTRILLKFEIIHYEGGTGGWRKAGEKWEECRWISDKARTGSDPHFEPWCGKEHIHTTDHIDLKECLAWLPTPS